MEWYGRKYQQTSETVDIYQKQKIKKTPKETTTSEVQQKMTCTEREDQDGQEELKQRTFHETRPISLFTQTIFDNQFRINH